MSNAKVAVRILLIVSLVLVPPLGIFFLLILLLPHISSKLSSIDKRLATEPLSTTREYYSEALDIKNRYIRDLQHIDSAGEYHVWGSMRDKTGIYSDGYKQEMSMLDARYARHGSSTYLWYKAQERKAEYWRNYRRLKRTLRSCPELYLPHYYGSKYGGWGPGWRKLLDCYANKWIVDMVPTIYTPANFPEDGGEDGEAISYLRYVLNRNYFSGILTIRHKYSLKARKNSAREGLKMRNLYNLYARMASSALALVQSKNDKEEYKKNLNHLKWQMKLHPRCLLPIYDHGDGTWSIPPQYALEEFPANKIFAYAQPQYPGAPESFPANDANGYAQPAYPAPPPSNGSGANIIDIKEAASIANKGQYGKNEYKLPPTSILREEGDAETISGLISYMQTILNVFKVNAGVKSVSVGPRVTRYEVRLGPGVRIAALNRIQAEIAMYMRAHSVRILAIPEKCLCGIEVPNRQINHVGLRSVLESEGFNGGGPKLPIPIGEDVSGGTIVGDLSEMPHLLVGGSTGSGKSVFINSLIASILFKSPPEEVRLALIDPKGVELPGYNGIPHLLHPVVADPQQAARILDWAVAEMERRYKQFAVNSGHFKIPIRDVEAFNRVSLNIKLPRIVVIIDELADLMYATNKSIETPIIQLAQKARAAGIHLVLATQRPDRDIVTGLIKANVPSKIAFTVSSEVNSRIILDTGGAEKLLGKGDMLYHPIGELNPVRVQGAFISDGEVQHLLGWMRDYNGYTMYDQDVGNFVKGGTAMLKYAFNGLKAGQWVSVTG